MASVPGGKLGFLAITAVAFVILGSVLEGIPAIVLFGPLLFPVAKAMGVHEVHYALVIILAMGIGLFAPPFGVGFYGACAIGRVSPDDALGRMWPLSRPRGGAGDRCRYRNPMDDRGTAATITSATTRAKIYGQIRHSASSGEILPIAQAP